MQEDRRACQRGLARIRRSSAAPQSLLRSFASRERTCLRRYQKLRPHRGRISEQLLEVAISALDPSASPLRLLRAVKVAEGLYGGRDALRAEPARVRFRMDTPLETTLLDWVPSDRGKKIAAFI